MLGLTLAMALSSHDVKSYLIHVREKMLEEESISDLICNRFVLIFLLTFQALGLLLFVSNTGISDQERENIRLACQDLTSDPFTGVLNTQ